MPTGSLSDPMGLGVRFKAEDMIGPEAAKASAAIKKLMGDANSATGSIKNSTAKIREGLNPLVAWGGRALAAAGVSYVAKEMIGMAAASEDTQASIAAMLIGQGYAYDEAKKRAAGYFSLVEDFARNTRTPLGDLKTVSAELVRELKGIGPATSALSSFNDIAITTGESIRDAAAVGEQLFAAYGEVWGKALSPAQKADKIAKPIIGTYLKAGVEVEFLTSALRATAGQAAPLGVPLEELTSTIGMLEKRLPQAGRDMSRFYLQIANFMNMTGNKGMLGNIRLTDDSGRFIGMVKFLEQIEKTFHINTKAADEMLPKIAAGAEVTTQSLQKIGIPLRYAAAMMQAFQAEGGKSLLMLVGHSKELKDAIDGLRDPGLSAMIEEVKKLREETTKGEWTTFKNNIELIGEGLAKTMLPALNEALGRLSQFLAEGNKKLEVDEQASGLSKADKRANILAMHGAYLPPEEALRMARIRGQSNEDDLIEIQAYMSGYKNKNRLGRYGPESLYDHSYRTYNTRIQINAQPGQSAREIAAQVHREWEEKNERASGRGF